MVDVLNKHHLKKNWKRLTTSRFRKLISTFQGTHPFLYIFCSYQGRLKISFSEIWPSFSQGREQPSFEFSAMEGCPREVSRAASM